MYLSPTSTGTVIWTWSALPGTACPSLPLRAHCGSRTYTPDRRACEAKLAEVFPV